MQFRGQYTYFPSIGFRPGLLGASSLPVSNVGQIIVIANIRENCALTRMALTLSPSFQRRQESIGLEGVVLEIPAFAGMTNIWVSGLK